MKFSRIDAYCITNTFMSKWPSLSWSPRPNRHALTKPAACVLALVLFGASSSAQQFGGAIFTTDAAGTTVNGNIYADVTSVYLNGGPQNTKSAGLPDGTYFFQVTDPSGATLLSSDQAVCRQLVVSGGVVVGPSSASGACAHAIGAYNSANGSTSVQLAPFNQTSNPGGEYKVYLISQANGAAPDPNDQTGLGLIFANSDAKSDNFKIRSSAAQPMYITGYKWYDTNTNGTYDSGEPYIPGWHIDAFDSSTGLSFFTYTDSNGAYSILADPANTYTVSEAFPNSTWIATTATSGDFDTSKTLTGPNFGNICVGSGGGLTIGYWGNKNGQAEWVPIPLNAPYVVNANGIYQNFSTAASYSAFKSWLGGATATNMSYMLSAQLAAMYENVHGGTTGPNGTRIPVNPGALVNVANLPAAYAVPTGCALPAITKGGFAAVGDLMNAASCSVSKVPTALSVSPYRSYEEWLKNQLNAANNDTTFVQVPTGGGIPNSCGFPAFSY
jgi:hypothetical protein